MLICPVCSTANSDNSISCGHCNSVFELSLGGVSAGPREQQTVASSTPSQGAAGGGNQSVGADLSPGDLLADRYEIVSRLGEGGMGTVYKAFDRELDRAIALKTIRPDVASSPVALRRLKQETLLARQVAHRNVVRVFDLGVAGGVRFITMELVEGESLKALVQRVNKLSADSARAIMTQVCEGLAAAHAEDVIHRDLKPQNVLIGTDGRARILDFGLARPVEQTGITRTGMIIGTPDYMSPEQALGQAADARSDIFSFGIIFYELLTGTLPFRGGTLVESFLARTRERARPIEFEEPSVPPEIARVVMRCLEPDPAHRYQRAKDILEELRVHDGSPDRERAATATYESGTLSPGAMLGSRYRIEAEAGEGGMGKVYRATDLDLNRTVALKVVRPDRAGTAESVERLKHEISLASRISHKNVLRIHDLGEVDGLCFVSMAWADGDDLAHLLRRSAPLAEAQIVALGMEICEGLDAACEQNIIHRDLKPANVLLDAAGHPCIADFGLASTMDAEQAPPIANPGEINGTPRYMSPEQVEGKRTDHRTDIYSLGLILYEMATGDIPFEDDSALQTMAQCVTETPKDPKLLNPAISQELANIILRCLERDPLRRYENAHALSNDLRGLGGLRPASLAGRVQKWMYAAVVAALVALTAAVSAWLAGRHNATEIPRSGKYVAVLPFRAVGADSNLKYEAEGVAESISARLFSLSSVHPVSPLALEQVDLTQPVKAIARKVGANLVIGGSMQSAGNSVTIITSIDNVETGKRLWTKSFSGMRADLLTLEDEICNGVIGALDVKPTLAERERTTVQPTQNLSAYDAYLKGRDTYKNRRDADGANAALTLFEQASAKDPAFALAWTGVADASLEMYRLKHDSFWSEKAIAAANEARSRNDNLPEVHLSLGSIYTATGKNAQAVSEIRRALQLEPNSDDGYVRLGRAYLVTGQRDAAIAALKKAVALNPYYWYNHNQLGIAYYTMGRDTDALQEFKRVVELDPTKPSAHNAMGIIYARHRPWEKCIPEFKKAIQLKPSANTYTNFATAYFNAGHYAESVPLFEKAAELDPADMLAVGNLADSYRQAKQREKAQAAYDRAIELAYKQLEVNPQDGATLGNLARFYGGKGVPAKAREEISRARSINAANSQLMYDEALVDALAGNPQESLRALTRALEHGYSVDEARKDPDLAAVRALPGFRELSKKFGG